MMPPIYTQIKHGLTSIILFLSIASQSVQALQTACHHPRSMHPRTFSTPILSQKSLSETIKLPPENILYDRFHATIQDGYFLKKSKLVQQLAGKKLKGWEVRSIISEAVSRFCKTEDKSHPAANVYEILSSYQDDMVQCVIDPLGWGSMCPPKNSFWHYYENAPDQVRKALGAYLSKVEPRYRLGNLVNAHEVLQGVSPKDIPVFLTKITSPSPLCELSETDGEDFRITFSRFNFNNITNRLIIVNEWGANHNSYKVHYRIEGGEGITTTRRDIFIAGSRDNADDFICQERLILPTNTQEQISNSFIYTLFINPYNPPQIDLNCKGEISVIHNKLHINYINFDDSQIKVNHIGSLHYSE